MAVSKSHQLDQLLSTSNSNSSCNANTRRCHKSPSSSMSLHLRLRTIVLALLVVAALATSSSSSSSTLSWAMPVETSTNAVVDLDEGTTTISPPQSAAIVNTSTPAAVMVLPDVHVANEEAKVKVIEPDATLELVEKNLQERVVDLEEDIRHDVKNSVQLEREAIPANTNTIQNVREPKSLVDVESLAIEPSADTVQQLENQRSSEQESDIAVAEEELPVTKTSDSEQELEAIQIIETTPAPIIIEETKHQVIKKEGVEDLQVLSEGEDKLEARQHGKELKSDVDKEIQFNMIDTDNTAAHPKEKEDQEVNTQQPDEQNISESSQVTEPKTEEQPVEEEKEVIQNQEKSESNDAQENPAEVAKDLEKIPQENQQQEEESEQHKEEEHQPEENAKQEEPLEIIPPVNTEKADEQVVVTENTLSEDHVGTISENSETQVVETKEKESEGNLETQEVETKEKESDGKEIKESTETVVVETKDNESETKETPETVVLSQNEEIHSILHVGQKTDVEKEPEINTQQPVEIEDPKIIPTEDKSQSSEEEEDNVDEEKVVANTDNVNSVTHLTSPTQGPSVVVQDAEEDSSSQEDDSSEEIDLPTDEQQHKTRAADDSTATPLVSIPPHDAEQKVNDNSADERTAHLSLASTSRSTLIITLCSAISVLFIIISLIIFVMSFHRQHGSLDIEMREQRFGKDEYDDIEDPATKLMEVELGAVVVADDSSEETEECL